MKMVFSLNAYHLHRAFSYPMIKRSQVTSCQSGIKLVTSFEIARR